MLPRNKYFIFPCKVLLLTFLKVSLAMASDKPFETFDPNKSRNWSFFTDGVMGGVSQGKAFFGKSGSDNFVRLEGKVSTENNGGFIQIRTKLSPEINSKDYNGVYVKVYGNQKNYNLHLRTGLTLAPWQYYSYTFATTENWSEIRAPLNEFKKSNFYQPKSILGQKIKSVGLVAGFDNFKSDICLSEIGFY